MPTASHSGSVPQPLPHVEQLHAYVPGKQPKGSGWVKLNTNENPFPPSPRIAPAIQAEFEALRLYPDPLSGRLRSALARQHGLVDEQVICGNGSDDLLNLIFRAFCQPGTTAAAMLEPSYSLYPVLAAAQNCQIAKVPLFPNGTAQARQRLDLDAIAATGARVFFLTSPNAPTGIAFGNRAIAQLAEAFDGLLVVDEAYADFAEENAVELLDAHPNILVTRSFSKSYGLAGLRIGYALGHPGLIAALDKVRDSYNLDRIAQAAALAALEDRDYFGAIIGKIRQIRDYYLAEFRQRGWDTFDSQANFIFTAPCDPQGHTGEATARALADHLAEHKILVRHFPSHPQTAPYLRISIGTEDEMLTLSEAIDAWSHSATK